MFFGLVFCCFVLGLFVILRNASTYMVCSLSAKNLAAAARPDELFKIGNSYEVFTHLFDSNISICSLSLNINSSADLLLNYQE